VKYLDEVSFTLNGTASSGLAVSYTSSNTNVATVGGSTVTLKSVGTTMITASQAGNSNWNAAANVPQTLTVQARDTDGDGVPDSIEPIIAGNILFGSGADVLDIRNGLVLGDISFGAGADTLSITGGGVVRGEDRQWRQHAERVAGLLHLHQPLPLRHPPEAASWDDPARLGWLPS
jgi:hypothetical protein